MSELKNLLLQIDVLKNEIEALRPLSKDLEGRILQKFRLDWNFHSNSIEGNQLTYGETKTFLLHGLTAKGKPLKDHLDIKGHQEGIELILDVIKHNYPLNEVFIRELHEIILHEPYQKEAISPEGIPTLRRIEIGQYKKSPNHVKTVTGEIFYFASPEETPAKMNDLMDWYRQNIDNQEVNAVVLAALFHYKFIRIHPFDDGNGRMARLLMNLVLMQKGFPPVVIKTQLKEAYYQALREADGGDENAFIQYIAQELLHSLEIYLKGAKGENIDEPDDLDKEIFLFKKSLEVYEERKFFVGYESVRTFAEILDAKIEKIADLFCEKRVNFGENYQELFGKIKIGNFQFSQKFNQFRRGNPFSISLDTWFSFEKSFFSAELRQKKYTLYYEDTDTRAYENFAKDFVREIMKKINEELEKQEND